MAISNRTAGSGAPPDTAAPWALITRFGARASSPKRRTRATLEGRPRPEAGGGVLSTDVVGVHVGADKLAQFKLAAEVVRSDHLAVRRDAQRQTHEYRRGRS